MAEAATFWQSMQVMGSLTAAVDVAGTESGAEALVVAFDAVVLWLIPPTSTWLATQLTEAETNPVKASPSGASGFGASLYEFRYSYMICAKSWSGWSPSIAISLIPTCQSKRVVQKL